jgi:hypothetical protein
LKYGFNTRAIAATMATFLEAKMTSKIRIKMGTIEVEFEGSEQFLKMELQEILSTVSRLYAQRGASPNDESAVEHLVEGNGNGKFAGTTATIASKLACNSAPELMIAAAAHLTLVANNAEFSRKELLDQMKSASGYYKASMTNNLGNYVNNRVKAGELVEVRKGHYALSPKKLADLRTTLAT